MDTYEDLVSTVKEFHLQSKNGALYTNNLWSKVDPRTAQGYLNMHGWTYGDRANLPQKDLLEEKSLHSEPYLNISLEDFYYHIQQTVHELSPNLMSTLKDVNRFDSGYSTQRKREIELEHLLPVYFALRQEGYTHQEIIS